MATTTHSSIYISRPSNYEGDGTDDKEEFIETCNIHFKDMFKDQKSISTLSEIEKNTLKSVFQLQMINMLLRKLFMILELVLRY